VRCSRTKRTHITLRSKFDLLTPLFGPNVRSPLWEGLGREDFQYPKNALQSGSSDDESNDGTNYPSGESLLVAHRSSAKSLTSLHPPAVHIFRLWQTFLVNVNPLLKIFHAPTVQQTILDASGDLENVSRPTEALMFAIYFIAVTSMNNSDCERILGEPRQVLVSKYCHAAQQALINSKFLRSLNITTLQALTIYMVSSRLFSCSSNLYTCKKLSQPFVPQDGGFLVHCFGTFKTQATNCVSKLSKTDVTLSLDLAGFTTLLRFGY